MPLNEKDRTQRCCGTITTIKEKVQLDAWIKQDTACKELFRKTPSGIDQTLLSSTTHLSEFRDPIGSTFHTLTFMPIDPSATRKSAQLSSRWYLCARKKHTITRPTTSLKSFCWVAFKTVPRFVWLIPSLSRPLSEDRPRLSPPGDRWCRVPWLCARRWCFKLLSTSESDLPRCTHLGYLWRV